MAEFNRTNVVREVFNWVHNYLDKPSEFYGGNKPCPFAAPALDKQQVKIMVGCLSTAVMEAQNWDDKHRLVLIAFEEEYEGNLTKVVESINSVLSMRDLVMLVFEPGEDDPEDPSLDPAEWGEVIDGAYTMVLLQRLSEVNHFSRLLDRQGYYVNCSADFMKYVNERRQLNARIQEDQWQEDGQKSRWQENATSTEEGIG
jgi:hypothetical protein